jgi:purine-cytosine permease-like protein
VTTFKICFMSGQTAMIQRPQPGYPDGSAVSSPPEAAPPGLELQAIAHHERKGSVTMCLLWVTMVASFPSVVIGFDWYRQGFSFMQVIAALASSIGILLLYSLPVCTIAVKTGLSFKYLCRRFFDSTLSRNLTVCLIFLYLGWYAVTALFMADACCGIAGSKQWMPVLAFLFCFAMAFNNFFGFKGVANFARFVAAPAVICWIVYTFIRVAPQVPECLKHSHNTVPFTFAFCSVSQFILGFAIWGNEADYWRNSKSSAVGTSIALLAALVIGEFVFPLTGWIVAAKTGLTDSAAATAYLDSFTFGSAGAVAILFLAAQYFAVNDSNLYAFAHGVESFTRMGHKKVVVAMAFCSGLLAVALTLSGTARALEAICTLNSVLLPTATVLIVLEWFVFRKQKLYDNQPMPRACKSVVIAWSAGATLGILTSGIIPGTKFLNVGVPALQAWLLAIAIYLPLRKLELSWRDRPDLLRSEILQASLLGCRKCAPAVQNVTN